MLSCEEQQALMLIMVSMKKKIQAPITMQMLKQTSGKGTYDRTILALYCRLKPLRTYSSG